MHVDPLLPILAAVSFGVFATALVLRRFGQPHLIGYLVAGVIVGPHGLGLVTDVALMSRLGAIGVVLLLFFVGMEVSPSRLLANWKASVIGTIIQIGASLAGVFVLGSIHEWPVGRIILLGFVISLSSTAVVIRLLQDSGRLQGRLGGQVLGILLTQDIAIIPMLIILGLLSGETPTLATLVRQSVGGVIIIGILVYVARKGTIHLPIGGLLGTDRELQVFAGLVVCLGLAFLSGVLDLSTALGALVGGMLISAARETHWIHEALNPFRVVLVAVFFVSVGMLLDLSFVVTEKWLIITLTGLVFVTNTMVNAVVLRCFGSSWRDCLYGGTLLAPIGELSFVLASVGAGAGIIGTFAYQATIATITSSLLLGPIWSALTLRLANYQPRQVSD